MKALSLILPALLISLSSPGHVAGADETDAPPLAYREVEVGAEGPWGKLEYYRVPLEFPNALLSTLVVPSQHVEWVFQAATQDELDHNLAVAGLTSSEVVTAFSGCTIIQDEDKFRVFPSDEAVIGMLPETRTKLYQLLALYDENRYYRRPVYINSQNLSMWFQGSRIPRAAIADISHLAYPTPNGHGYFLSDVAFTLRRARNAIEERDLLQGMLRANGLIVRLRVSKDSLTPGIGEYWTAGYKNKAVMPLLESVVEHNDGGTIDVAHLLPGIPRQYLNQFPDALDAANGRLPDWFWTCFNFFRTSPRDVYADSPERETMILKEFEAALPPNQFGDMLLLNSNGRIIHGCIYIAEDIVYTKNGPDIYSPWVLMKIQDVVGYHDVLGDGSIGTYRKRAPIAVSRR